jgi:hypothetical protein
MEKKEKKNRTVQTRRHKSVANAFRVAWLLTAKVWTRQENEGKTHWEK